MTDKKATITEVSTGYQSNLTLNDNFEAINDKFDNTLSLDGSTPNQMGADLDMNSNDVLNVGVLGTDSLLVGGVDLADQVAAAALSADEAAASAAGAQSSEDDSESSALEAAASAALAATYDPTRRFNTVTLLLADTELTYTPSLAGSVVAGDILLTHSEGFSYEVAASGASDNHVTTAGGVKLYVLAAAEGYYFSAFGPAKNSTSSGTGTDDWPLLVSAVTVAGEAGTPLIISEGGYRMSPTGPLPLATTKSVIRGVDPSSCRFYIDAGMTFELGSGAGDPAGKFWGTFEGVWFIGNSDLVLRIGSEDRVSAILNSFDIDVRVNNSKQTLTATGVEVNYVLQSRINIASNCGQSGNPLYHPTGFGIALKLRQARFCKFSYALGNANIGLYITDNNVNGCEFAGSCGIEEVYTGIKCDSSSAQGNIFNGGTIVAVNTFDIRAGTKFNANNMIFGTGYTGWSLFTAGGERMACHNCIMPEVFVANFPLPSSGVLQRNLTGKTLQVRMVGSLNAFIVGKASGASYGLVGLGSGSQVAVSIEPYGSVTATYTGSPVWNIVADG